MTDESGRTPPKGPDVLFGYLIPLVFIGLSVADFVRDGQIDKYLLAALVVFGLGALGYRIDSAFMAYINNRAGIPATSQDNPKGTSNDK